MKRTGLFALFILSHALLFAQFQASDSSLAAKRKQSLGETSDSARLAQNREFEDELEQTLQIPGSYGHPFESLTTVGNLRSGDDKFRILVWNLPLNDGTFRYFGFIQLKDKVFKLADRSENYSDPEAAQQTFSCENWYGALYYRIIKTSHEGQDYYTLLGWDGRNRRITCKMIDVLTFSPSDEPVFGKPIFKTASGTQNRVFVNYAKQAAVGLNYDYQTLNIPKGNRTQKKKVWLIVFDHLVPLNQELTGQYDYYVPTGDQWDGYWFDDGFWKFVENIEVVNPKDKTKKTQPIKKTVESPY